MYAKDGRVVVKKTVDNNDHAVRTLYEENSSETLAFHVRNQTLGSISLENCHPFWVTSKDWGDVHDIAMMHNGTIRDVQVDPGMADSNNFASYFLRPMLQENPDLYDSNAFWHLVSGLIGRNKLILLRGDAKFIIVNAGMGRILEPWKIWVSSDVRLTPVGGTPHTSSPSTLNSTVAAKAALGLLDGQGCWVTQSDGLEHYQVPDEARELTLADLTGRDKATVTALVQKFPDLAAELLLGHVERDNAAHAA
jgi:hypothetical protein